MSVPNATARRRPDHARGGAPGRTLDIAVTQAVIESGQPMLTISLGMQILNVVCGGTLVQDLVETTVPHRSSPHDVVTVEGSRLRKVTGADTLYRVVLPPPVRGPPR